MTTTANTFELALVNELNLAEKEAHQHRLKGGSSWTDIIKDKLARSGEQLGYKICTSSFKDVYNSEWLFDMVWYEENAEKRLISVPLVVESEWGKREDQIKFDFEKLLLANAKHRLMICQVTDSRKQSLEAYFKKAISDYQLNRKGDRYLIAMLSIEQEEFEFVVFEK